MADPHYILEEHPAYNEAIRALQDSDPARASTTFNPVLLEMLNNTHHVKKALEAHEEDQENPHAVTVDKIGAVPKARKVNGKPLTGDIALAAADVGADSTGSASEVQRALNEHSGNKNNPHGVTVAQLGAVPVARKVAGKTLGTDITLIAADVGADPSGSANNVQMNLNAHKGDMASHVTTAEKTAWNAKETPAGAQAKADAVQGNLAAHTNNKSNPHGVTATQVGAANVSLSNVSNANFKSKAESAGAGGQKIFDQVIRTQAEFNTLIASPTWLGAVSVCFVGNGGTLKFTKSDGKGIKIPQTVKQIQGMNSATIDVTNGLLDLYTSNGCLWYETLPKTNDYYICGMTVNCNGANSWQFAAFHNCRQLSNCTCNSDRGCFQSCTELINCAANSTNSDGNCFYSCTYLVNCNGIKKGGSSSCFAHCDCLTNCVCTAENISFLNCTRLINCSSSSSMHSFASCTQLTNCKGIDASSWCFRDSSQLINCTGTSIGKNATAFRDCTQLTNCSGTGTATDTGTGYGFVNCSYLNGCKQGDSPSTTAFLGGTNTKVDTLTVMAT